MAKSRKPKQSEAAPSEGDETLAKKIWLAGIGAYGKSFADAQEQIDRAGQEATRYFTELVNKGQVIEDQTRAHLDEARERLSRDARDRIEEAKDKIVGAKDRITGAAESNTRSVEELICRVRERMGFDSSVVERLDRLSDRVEDLAGAVSSLVSGESESTPAARSRVKTTAKSKTRPKMKAKAKAKAKAKPKSKARPKAKTNAKVRTRG